MINTEEFLDWIVRLDLKHYQTESFPDYTPTGPSHFYINRSLERFTSEQLIKIYSNKMDDELCERWNDAIAQSKRPR